MEGQGVLYFGCMNTAVLIINACIIVLLGSFVYAGWSLAPWLPSKRKDFDRMFRLVDLKPGERFYDLGCGDGRVVMEAGTVYKANAIGIELTPVMYTVCRLRQLFSGARGVTFKWKSLYHEDLRQADVIYLFGLPGTLQEKMTEKLNRELKPGARVVSYVFTIAGWTPTVVDRPTKKDVPIYLYTR